MQSTCAACNLCNQRYPVCADVTGRLATGVAGARRILGVPRGQRRGGRGRATGGNKCFVSLGSSFHRCTEVSRLLVCDFTLTHTAPSGSFCLSKLCEFQNDPELQVFRLSRRWRARCAAPTCFRCWTSCGPPGTRTRCCGGRWRPPSPRCPCRVRACHLLPVPLQQPPSFLQGWV